MSEPIPPLPPPTDLAIIVIGRMGSEDLSAVLMAPTGEILFQHVSSSIGWARHDLTNNFGRREELDARYPEGWTVSVYDGVPTPTELVTANREFYSEKANRG